MSRVHIEPWAEGDLELLVALLADPEMTKHVGGPETREKLEARHRRFLAAATPADGPMYTVVLTETGERIGNVGFWERTEADGERVYETGWFVLPAWHGRGIAVEAMRELIPIAAASGRNRWLYAYPAVENAPSNAICRKLGFEHLRDERFEYPPGNWLECNVWRLDLAQQDRHQTVTG